MKYRFLFILFLLAITINAQKRPEDFGYNLIELPYQKDTVKIIVHSKKGEETKQKPLFFFCQGSLPQPVLKYDHRGLYGFLPFEDDELLEKYHVVIVGKPGIPVIADASTLGSNYTFQIDGKYPLAYSNNNNLEYYTSRNLWILNKLLKKSWIAPNGLVVAGHSEGTYIASKMAITNKKVSRLILSSGNPYGRITSILAQDRYTGNDESTLDYWKAIVEDKNETGNNGTSDSYKTTYSFSTPINNDLLNLKIPVLYCYGTKDWSTPYNDLFQTEAIRLGKENFTFLAYRNTEHNYFPVNDKLQPDYNIYNWTKVGNDWVSWLKSN